MPQFCERDLVQTTTPAQRVIALKYSNTVGVADLGLLATALVFLPELLSRLLP
jgi:hypothetical protein